MPSLLSTVILNEPSGTAILISPESLPATFLSHCTGLLISAFICVSPSPFVTLIKNMFDNAISSLSFAVKNVNAVPAKSFNGVIVAMLPSIATFNCPPLKYA